VSGRPAESRIPPALARRLDRLARRAHAFHRWAHHPLCAPYAGEVLRVGRRARVCRGCAFTALGAVLGGAAGAAARVPPDGALALLAVAALLLVRRGVSGRRASKLATRLAPAAALAGIAALGLRSLTPAGLTIAAIVGLTAAAATAAYRRRGPDRSPCDVCPERAAPAPCSGLTPIARREAAFARASARLLGGALPRSR
jgi:hypothetical protein